MTRKIIIISIFLLFASALKSQSRWNKIFYDEKDAIGNAIINSYDRGILVVGKHGSNAVEYNWLIKTDINGDIIWEKAIGAPGTNIKISDLAYNHLGDLYLVGLTGFYNEDDYDPLIMKLNACGEKEWCKVFYEERNNFSNAVVATPDGGCVVVLRYMTVDPTKDRICLAKLDTYGTLQWKHCYNSSDTSLYYSDAYDLVSCPDGGFLISGVCDYVNPDPPQYLWPKPYYIKTDSLGNFEWETVVHSEISDKGGSAWSAVINGDSNYYYSAISHYYFSSGNDAASLLKMDLQGNVIDIYDIAPPNIYGKMVHAKFITDTTLAASAVYGSALPPKPVIIDTLGNILHQNPVLDNERMGKVEVTFDRKLLYFVNVFDNFEFDAYLFKLNQNLLSDSLYTQPFVYDSLCPYTIVSDTIVQDDCGLIVGMEEIYTLTNESENKVIIYPNPAKDRFKVQSTMFEVGGCHIEVFDLFGRKTEEILLPKEQSEVELITTGWKKGMYVVRVIGRDGIVGSGKVVIR
ncbi:MAG: hypothetical protein DRJ05_12980 [Bacteroidetes bacterium]|nr:MAG: hypothetical protein DRI89_01700 [Bacteroidota bacterium]RLD55410.1 MAG: hypothetical protein DRJ05_12980 [Bacteroidota bacterium]